MPSLDPFFTDEDMWLNSMPLPIKGVRGYYYPTFNPKELDSKGVTKFFGCNFDSFFWYYFKFLIIFWFSFFFVSFLIFILFCFLWYSFNYVLLFLKFFAGSLLILLAFCWFFCHFWISIDSLESLYRSSLIFIDSLGSVLILLIFLLLMVLHWFSRVFS